MPSPWFFCSRLFLSVFFSFFRRNGLLSFRTLFLPFALPFDFRNLGRRLLAHNVRSLRLRSGRIEGLAFFFVVFCHSPRLHGGRIFWLPSLRIVRSTIQPSKPEKTFFFFNLSRCLFVFGAWPLVFEMQRACCRLSACRATLQEQVGGLQVPFCHFFSLYLR